MLLGEVTATVKRFAAGSWSSGDFVRGAADPDFTVVGSFQPNGATVADPLNRGARKAGSFIFIVEFRGQPEVQIANLGSVQEGDQVVIFGNTYIVREIEEWQAHMSGLPHRKFIIERQGVDE